MPATTEEKGNDGHEGANLHDRRGLRILGAAILRFYEGGERRRQEQSRAVRLHSARPYASSPFMSRIKTGRSFTVESMCDFTEAEHMQKNLESSSDLKAADETKADLKITPELKEAKDENSARQAIIISADKVEDKCMKDDGSVLAAAQYLPIRELI
ncbi:PREDICTED: uncharacterized protein LOC101303128 [Fragaria vesca subsp. vesca]|uniref:uncharacterized protein LOC101303128 n=1 Tax=Fragaria vesca subsp. vesca TaxID=101020 RepID=UPI0002C2F5AB|nr:PREDICTED: uncharacterized protein LOC101303128 [Fragaria vesca subsp. vesca]